MASISFSTTHAGLLLNRLHLSRVELVYTSHGRWPQPPVPRLSRTSPSPLRISVLDSSFNPPTRAHLALANAYPPQHPYDANLLLLSVRNADKSLKRNDASYVQRLSMMMLLAKEIEEENIAIAIIDEPTFVGKSSTLLEFLRQRLSNNAESIEGPSGHANPNIPPDSPKVQLTFLQGFDTLERLFAPRYYPSQQAMLTSLRRFFSAEGDDSRVLCARRNSPPTREESDQVQKTLQIAEEFISSERVVLVDIGVEERTLSSTSVRIDVARGGESWKRSVPDRIAGYIIEQELYSDDNLD